jgi:hypothetical protein
MTRPRDYLIVIEGEIDGKVTRTTHAYFYQLPGKVKVFSESIRKEASGRPWAVYIRLPGSMVSRKGSRKTGYDYHKLAARIDKVARTLDI